jgi:tetratricopeptide (TPR) repeat protein
MRVANERITRAVEQDPADAMNWLVFWKINPTAMQGTAILRATETNPTLALVQYELGQFELALGKYTEAKEAFERALQVSPHHFRSVVGLAYATVSADPNADVEPLYRKAADIAPRFLEVRDLLGSYYATIEETEKAEKEFEAALQANQKYYPAHLSLGLTLLRAGRFAEAEPSLLRVVELDPANADAHYYLGNIAAIRGDFMTAKAEYDQALKFRVNFADAAYAMGLVLQREGDTEKALNQYDQALRMAADYADAHLARAEIRAGRRQLMDAVQDLNRAIELYRQQIAALEAERHKSVSRAWNRKAEAARQRMSGLEKQLERAIGLRKILAQPN